MEKCFLQFQMGLQKTGNNDFKRQDDRSVVALKRSLFSGSHIQMLRWVPYMCSSLYFAEAKNNAQRFLYKMSPEKKKQKLQGAFFFFFCKNRLCIVEHPFFTQV